MVETPKHKDFRVEIDTSPPFESVKEAASRFGEIGYWKPPQSQHEIIELESPKLEDHVEQLKQDLFLKERETLEVLKELEATKNIVEQLKSRIRVEETADLTDSVSKKENNESFRFLPSQSSSPGLILMELKQAKLNISRTNGDLDDIRASVGLLKKNLEEEKNLLEKTRTRLKLNSLEISALEKELSQTRRKLRLVKSNNPSETSFEIERLSSEAEKLKKNEETVRNEIEQTQNKIKTVEVRLVAAQKMKEAAKAAESAALAEIKALSVSETEHETVTVPYESYVSLTKKAKEAEDRSRAKIEDAMLLVEKEKALKTEISNKVEEATNEAETNKKALEDALKREEASNFAKVEVEEAFRKLKSEPERKKVSESRGGLRFLDVNGQNLVRNPSSPILKTTLSIGQILGKKLLPPDESVRERGTVKQTVSLSQMLSKPDSDTPSLRKKVKKVKEKEREKVKEKEREKVKEEEEEKVKEKEREKVKEEEEKVKEREKEKVKEREKVKEKRKGNEKQVSDKKKKSFGFLRISRNLTKHYKTRKEENSKLELIDWLDQLHFSEQR